MTHFSAIEFLAGLAGRNDPLGVSQPEQKAPLSDSAGRRLLYSVWAAGYTLQLVKSDSNPTGFAIIPIGPITPTPELLTQYEAHHDAAVRALVEACRFCGIDPLRWHEAVQAFTEAAEQLEATSESAKNDWPARAGLTALSANGR